jgi:class 3 adenylate cyclase
LAVTCPDCGFANEPDVDFCGGCGKTLSESVPSPVDAPRKRETAEPERRQLTVMFCDLVGSTALAERLDPEELHELLAQYQDVCAKVIQRYEGYIARYVGDGLLVYFGYPQAHEDDPQRAVRTGLSIVTAVKDLDAKFTDPGVDLAVRIGITTGLVVAGDIGSSERREEKAIVGKTPNLAARLQALSEPSPLSAGVPNCVSS